jgi:hypothetical protein
MNIDNLKEGMIIKNYKELCKVLEIEPTTSNSKKAQFKELERYINYEKQGQKIIVKEIYQDVKEKVDMRNIVKEDDKRHDGNNNIYGEDIKQLLLLMMASSMDNEIILPISILLNKLSMTNYNYSLGRRNQDKLSEVLEIDEKYVHEFYDTTHSNLKRTLENNLNLLDRKSLLRWQTVRMICKKVAVVQYNEFDEIEIDVDTNKVQYNIKEEYSVATKEQDLIILEAENEILEEMKLEDINDVFRHSATEVFYNKVNKIISKKANIKYYFNGYKLIFNRNKVIKELEKYGEDLNNIRKQLNNKVKEKLFDNAIKRQDKVEKECESVAIGIPLLKDVQKIRIKEDYLNIIQLIINNVIDLKAKDIRNKLKQKEDNNKVQY